MSLAHVTKSQLIDMIPASVQAQLGRYVRDKENPDDFLLAVLMNDLYAAINTGSREELQGLPALVVYLTRTIDENAWGSEAKVLQWLSDNKIAIKVNQTKLT